MNRLFNVDDELDINFIFNLIKIKKTKILKSSIFFGCLFFLFSFTQSKLFMSNISFFKINDTSSLSSFSVDTILSGGSGSINDRLELDIKDILSSQKLSIQIVNHLWSSIDNKSLITFWELDKKSFLDEFSKDEYSDLKIQEAAVKELIEKRISIDEDLKTGLITVSLETENRMLSVEILNYIKEFVLVFSSSNIKDLSTKEIEYLNTRVQTVEAELENIDSKIISFLEKNKNYTDSPELTLLYQSLMQDKLFIQNVMITLLQQVEMAKLNEIKISPVIESLDSPIISAKHSYPNRILWLLIGCFLGLLISISSIIFKSAKVK
tara:strand:- start:1293 stop:2261 length:969 start_codon:yes stop_codon:yes gene_type:complete